MLHVKHNVIVLNSCPLGKAETTFWNHLIRSNSNDSHFKFFSSEPGLEIEADEFILINYGWTIFENVADELGGAWAEKIEQIADKDKIWEIYDKEHSVRMAGSWFLFWSFVIKLFNPVKVIVWNGHHVPEAALIEICRVHGIPYWYAERGPLRGTFALDRKGVNFASGFVSEYDNIEINASEERVGAFSKLYFQHGDSNWAQPAEFGSRAAFVEALGIPAGKNIVFFPAQVDRDSNAKLYSPHFSSTAEAINAVVHWCNEHSDSIYLLVKKHPMQGDSQELPSIEPLSGQYLEDVHILDCIRYSHAMVSVNSSAAVEAALLGKPVLLLGQSLLGCWDGALKLDSRDQLGASLSQLCSLVEDSGRINNTMYFSKLLFGHLLSAEREYLDLGLSDPGAALGEFPEKVTPSDQWLNNRVNNMGFLIPIQTERNRRGRRVGLQLESSYQMALDEISRLRSDFDELKGELDGIKSRRLYRILENLKYFLLLGR